MRVALWSGIPVVVAVPLTLLSKCMGVAWGCGITGAVVVLLGTLVLISDQWEWFRRKFNRMSPRFGAIEKGLAILRDDSAGMRELKEGEPGFQEILKVIAERTRKERAEISGICCGPGWGENGGEGSIVHEHISLRPRGSSPNLLATREAVEQWLHDARLRCLSLLGFIIVFCGVVLGLVSLIMQAIASGNY